MLNYLFDNDIIYPTDLYYIFLASNVEENTVGKYSAYQNFATRHFSIIQP